MIIGLLKANKKNLKEIVIEKVDRKPVQMKRRYEYPNIPHFDVKNLLNLKKYKELLEAIENNDYIIRLDLALNIQTANLMDWEEHYIEEDGENEECEDDDCEKKEKKDEESKEVKKNEVNENKEIIIDEISNPNKGTAFDETLPKFVDGLKRVWINVQHAIDNILRKRFFQKSLNQKNDVVCQPSLKKIKK